VNGLVADGPYGVVEVFDLGAGVGEVTCQVSLDGPQTLDDVEQAYSLWADLLAGCVHGHAHAQLGVAAGEGRFGVTGDQQGGAVAEGLAIRDRTRVESWCVRCSQARR